MATGIQKHEKKGSDAISADLYAEEPYPLPPAKDCPVLTYQNKIKSSDILQPIAHPFLELTSKGISKLAADIRPNGFILADNYFGMQSLLNSCSGRVSLIYLDPPFSTGMEFHSRDLVHAYKDKFGSAAYVEFMRRRLILMRELLADDGSIYLHIGHQMLFHLKVIMDEIFGESNFRNLIIRKKCSSKNYTRKQYPNLHDYILFYTKTKRYKWNQPAVSPSEEWINKEYPKVDSKGRYKLVPVHAPGTRHGETGKEWRGMMPPPGKHWQYTPSKLDELDRAGEIHWSRNNNPRRKVYLEDTKQLPLTDYWDGFRDAHHQSIEITGYPTEKNLDLLKTIVMASSNPNDLVLDPFAGSGTTLQAANDLGREWLGMDESLTAAKALVRRMRHGSSKMGDFVRKTQPQNADMFPETTSGQRAHAKKKAKPTCTFSFYVDEAVFNANKDAILEIASL